MRGVWCCTILVQCDANELEHNNSSNHSFCSIQSHVMPFLLPFMPKVKSKTFFDDEKCQYNAVLTSQMIRSGPILHNARMMTWQKIKPFPLHQLKPPNAILWFLWCKKTVQTSFLITIQSQHKMLANQKIKTTKKRTVMSKDKKNIIFCNYAIPTQHESSQSLYIQWKTDYDEDESEDE